MLYEMSCDKCGNTMRWPKGIYVNGKYFCSLECEEQFNPWDISNPTPNNRKEENDTNQESTTVQPSVG